MGLAIVQYQYLKIGLNLAKVQFRQKLTLASESIRDGLARPNQLSYLVGTAMQGDSTSFRLEVDSVRSASRFFLDSYLSDMLAAQNIDADFSYRLFSKDSLYLQTSTHDFDQGADGVRYNMELQGYLPKLLDGPVILQLDFKDLNSYFLSQLNGLTLPSILFMIGIILALIWALRTYYWQRNVIMVTHEFIDNLTHELKTPIFSIGLATRLWENQVTPEQRPLLDIVRQQVQRLTEHIDRVLELGDLESKRKWTDLTLVDFRPNLEKLCRDFVTLGGMEELEFTYEIHPGNYTVKAHVGHLENAINNLLDNARKYSDDPKIRLEAFGNAKYMTILIKDNGIGMSKTDQKQVFKKFYRIPQGDTHKVRGYGLGLSYVKQVADLHHGRIRLESDPGNGTLAALEIPVANER